MLKAIRNNIVVGLILVTPLVITVLVEYPRKGIRSIGFVTATVPHVYRDNAIPPESAPS